VECHDEEGPIRVIVTLMIAMSLRPAGMVGVDATDDLRHGVRAESMECDGMVPVHAQAAEQEDGDEDDDRR